MKKCYLCGEIKKLCKAHIINRSAVKSLNDDKDKVLLLKRNDPYKQYDLVSDHLYDETILCSNCDNLYANDENYFMAFINQRFKEINLTKISTSDKEIYSLIEYNIFDKKKFKTALLFILWKSSISKQPAFQKFSLGKDEDEIKNIITSNLVNDSSLYPFVIYSLKKVNNGLAYGIKPPFITEYNGIKMACFLLLDYLLILFLTSENVTKFYSEKISNSTSLYVQECFHKDGEELLMEVLNISPVLKYPRPVQKNV